MPVQNMQIVVKGHLCFHSYDKELMTSVLSEVAKKVYDAVSGDCNTIEVTAHYDESGMDYTPMVIDVEL